MSKKNKFLGTLAFQALIYGLLFYAMSRTLDFVSIAMPDDKKIWGYLFLLATGGGALIWKTVYLNKAEGSKQRGISFGMAVFDLVAELVLVYADTVLVASKHGIGQMSSDEVMLFIYASVGVVGLNIIAGFMFGLFDPKTEQEERARDLVDDVAEAALKNLNTPEAKARMISEHRPLIEAAVMARVAEQVAQMAEFYGNVPALGESVVSMPKAETSKRKAETSGMGELLANWLAGVRADASDNGRRYESVTDAQEGKPQAGDPFRGGGAGE